MESNARVSNVFVTDGSCTCHLLLVKILLYFYGLTARAADYAVKELKKGNI
jgi:hypothetical protein